MANAVLSQLQRRTGAGRFVWSSAEKHDFAVASDFAVPAFELFGRDLDCSRQRARIAQHIKWMSKVNDNDLLAGFEFVFQFIGSDAIALDLFQKALAFPPAVEDVGDHARGKQNQKITAEALRVKVSAIEPLAKDKADTGKSARPQQSAQKIKKQKPVKINPHHARQRWRRRVEARHELADKQRSRSELRERGFSTAHARVRLKCNAAEQIEDHPAAPLAEGIPERVGTQGSKCRNESGEREVHPALGRQRTGGQQQRRSRNGQAALL